MMKAIIVCIVLLIISGCSQAPFRTGIVCVQPFETNRYSTSDPVEVKQDVVDKIELQLRKDIVQEILNNTKLTVLRECLEVDYILSGYIRRVDTQINQQTKGFLRKTSVSNRFYSIGATGDLKDKNNKQVIAFDSDQSENSLHDVLEHIANDIADAIKKVEK